MVRSLEVEFRAEVRAREAKALCIVMELKCVGGGGEAQTILLLQLNARQPRREIGYRGGLWRRNGRYHMCRKFQGIIEKSTLGPHHH